MSLTQALTRDGFDLSRHSWSLLSNGSLGSIQITDFLVTGLLVIAGAVGVRRSLGTGRAATWAPRLLAAFGVGMIGDAFLEADPAMGFRVGTPDSVGEVGWHGVAHLAVGGVGFLCLIAACFALARRFAAEDRRGWSAYSIVAGIVFFGGFVGIASGAGSTASTVSFACAVLFVLTWLSAVSVHLYRRVR